MSAGEVFLLCRQVRASAPAGVAPEPPGDSGRIIWGVFMLPAGEVFVLLAGAHERTCRCSPEPLGDSGRIVWGCLLAGVCACFLV